MLGEEERASLLSMEAELRRSIVGQDEAIATIARCVRLSRAGLRYHDRPLGVFLMLGPTVRCTPVSHKDGLAQK